MKALLTITLLFLSGCTQYRTLIGSYGAESADASLETAEWALCKASTSGALERRYQLFSAPETQKGLGWARLCHDAQ